MGPVTSGQSLRRLINRCYMSEGNGKVTPQDIIGEKIEDALTKTTADVPWASSPRRPC